MTTSISSITPSYLRWIKYTLVGVALTWTALIMGIKPPKSPPLARPHADTQSFPNIVNPRYQMTDDRRDHYGLSAQNATQITDQLVQLILPKADILTSTGDWSLLQSSRGAFDQGKEYLQLQNDVILYHDSGHEFHTNNISVDFKRSLIKGSDDIIGEGPTGSITSKGLEMDPQKDTLRLIGYSSLTIRPEQLR